MTQYINEVRAIGAKPILVTSMVRRQWDKSDPNKINSTLTPYAEAVRALAKEKNVPLVDLYTSSKKLCEQLGKEKCYEFSPVKDNSQFDNTHLNVKGSMIFARLVVEDLIKAVPELKPSSAANQLRMQTHRLKFPQLVNKALFLCAVSRGHKFHPRYIFWV